MPSLDCYRISKELNLEDFEYGSKIEQKYFFVRFDSFLDGFKSYNNIYISISCWPLQLCTSCDELIERRRSNNRSTQGSS